MWQEGSSLDQLDKRISSPVFHLRLPAILETLLSLPGAFMGLPHAFLAPTPLALAYLASPPTDRGFVGTGLLLALAVGLSAFFGGLKGYLNFRQTTKQLLLTLPIFTLSFLSLGRVPAAARSVGFTSITCTVLTVALTIPLKALSNRLRPAAALKLGEKVAERRSPLVVPYIQAMCVGGQSKESLPSADAAVMAANALLLSAWSYPPAPWAPAALGLTMIALCFFGRMYFWAHHLLDVLTGAAVGAIVTLSLRHFGLGAQLSHTVVALVLFIAALVYMQRRTKVFSDEGHSVPVSSARE